jgi:radical SAM/SPASM domain protein of ACGX system
MEVKIMGELDIKEKITEISSKVHPTFTLQWHLTTACPNHCKHCYMERNSRILPLEACKKIVDDFKSLLERWSCNGRIHFTGGDPLLYPYFFELLIYVRSQIPEIIIGILGNPELLTEEIVEKLKTQEIYSYQMSLDGLEKTHDYFRYSGSFKKTIEKIRLLRKYEMRTVIMNTVSKVNMDEIPALIDFVAEEIGVELFGFHRFVPVGNGKEIKEAALFSPLEYKDFLSKLNEKYQEHKGAYTFFGGGEPLWILLEWENGTFQKPPKIGENKLLWSGCSIGCSELCILEDGTVLACRRLSIPIGKVPTQKIRDIFILSERLNKMREVEKLEKCKDCELLSHCRGCRAMSYAIKGDYFASDPHCWKQI